MDSSTCPICLTPKSPSDSIKCSTCLTSFCKKCAFFWKIFHDICPLKCSSPWLIDYTFDEYDGFFFCYSCKRLGSLLCPKSTCRFPIKFIKVAINKTYFCEICYEKLCYFEATPHEKCEMWQKSFYFHCKNCEKKYCDCITKRKINKNMEY